MLYSAVAGTIRTDPQDGFIQVSKPTKSRSKTQLNRAQLKAYEARRAEEVERRAAEDAADEVVARPASVAVAGVSVPRRRIYALSHEQEMAIIRADLKRLLTILAVLVVVLIIAAILLN